MHATTLPDTQGALFISLTVCCMLYGLTSCQALTYLRRKESNMKIMVTSIWALETVHTSLLIHLMYFYTIINHGDISGHEKPVWSILAQALPAALIIGITQCVWIMRIYALSRCPKRSLIRIGMFSIVLGYAACAFVWVPKSIGEPDWIKVQFDHLWLLILTLSLVTLNDVLATAILCISLYRANNGVRRSDNLVRRIYAYALNTGALTCLGSVSTVVTVSTTASRLDYIAVYVVFIKIYANSLIAMLIWQAPARQSDPKDTTIEFTTVLTGLSASDTAFTTLSTSSDSQGYSIGAI